MNTIRHTILCTLLLPAALLAVSCRKGAEEDVQGPGGITLTLRMDDASLTKTEYRPGDDSRNENVLEWVDLFFFSGSGGSGTEVYRTPYKSTIPVQDSGDPTLYTVSMFLPNDTLDDIFGTHDPGAGNSVTAKIAVVGNGDAVSSDGYYMRYPAAPASVQGIRESVARTNFDAWYGENLDYLIMCGNGDITLTHNATTHEIKVTGNIPMIRSYAKMDIALILPTDGRMEISGRTYEADLDNMTIEVLNIVNVGYVGSDEDHMRDCATSEFVSTSNYPRALTASGTPLTATHNCFYTYPRLFSDEPEKKTEFRIAIPWRPAGGGENDPWRVGYYRIPVADETAVNGLYANHYYHTEATIHTLGSAVSELAEDLEGTWSILDWGDAPVYGAFNQYHYLIAYPSLVSMPGTTTGIASYKSSSSITNCTVTRVRAYGTNASGQENYEDLTINAALLTRYVASYNSTNKTVSLSHALTGMYYRQEITVTLTNNDGLSEEIVFEQVPPIEVRSTGHQGGQDNFFIDGFKMGEGTSLNGNDYRRPPDSNTAMALKYNLRFKVSAFTSKNNTYVFGNPSANPEVRHQYIIGDPRVTQTKYSESDFRASGSYQWTKTQLDKILIADTRISGADWIAPEFITCSGYARAPKLSLAQLEMRAAMYQESGYPAGRWRLMTEAEYKFLLNLQLNDIIPTFFYEVDNSGDAPYFTAQGTCFEINQGGASYRMISPAPATAYARFVYDTWYWGPDPVPAAATTYTPMP